MEPALPSAPPGSPADWPWLSGAGDLTSAVLVVGEVEPLEPSLSALEGEGALAPGEPSPELELVELGLLELEPLELEPLELELGDGLELGGLDELGGELDGGTEADCEDCCCDVVSQAASNSPQIPPSSSVRKAPVVILFRYFMRLSSGPPTGFTTGNRPGYHCICFRRLQHPPVQYQ